MAPKRPNPIEKLPNTSSSEDVSEEEQPPKTVKSSSDDVSGSGSESESDSNPPPPIVAKPISSRPMDDPPQSKKPRSNFAKPSTKRPVDEDIVAADEKESKRAKNKDVQFEGEASKSPENYSKKKALFERIFQPEHEVTILRGMLEYSSKNGADPVADVDGFYQYIKKKLVDVDFNRAQLSDKMKRMRKKYENNARKGKKGAERTFSKAVEQESYHLSKTLWGDEGINLGGGVKVVDHSKSNGKAKKTPKSQMPEDARDELLASIRAPKDEELEKRDAMKQNSGPSNSFWINKSIVSSGLDESLMKEGLELIDGAKKSELEEKWRKLLIDETEIFLRRIALIHEQTKLGLDAFKKQ